MEKLIRKRRSIRRFQQRPIQLKELERYVDDARLAPSAANLQPLEYLIVHKSELLDLVFGTLKWAGYIRPLGNPPEKERPVAYVVVLVNTEIKKDKYEKDAGAAVENLILGALADGVGSCWISSVDRNALSEILNIPQNRLISDVIALGYPNEEPVVVETAGVEYFKDDQGCLNVPKRPLHSIIHYDRYQEKPKPESAEKDDNGEEMEWVRVFETSVEEEAVIIKGFLENHGIPCVMESSKFHEMPVNFSSMSQTNLLVPFDRQEETICLIEERKLITECPHCGELNFKGGLFCSQCWKSVPPSD